MNKGTAIGTARDAQDHFVPVVDLADLDRLLAESAEEPVVLFKHDFACPISANAYRELAAIPAEISLIDVERQIGLADEVVNRTGIDHQSPQVIVLRNGQPIYAASHWDISGEEVARATRAA
jgi:bacillithiol system protein YtxJ